MYPRPSFSVARSRARSGSLRPGGRVLRLATASALVVIALLGWGGLTTAHAGDAGAVYTSTNDPAGNHVLAFHRDADGSLTPAGRFATGGMGTGSGLGSQGALVLTQDHRLLYVVNAGSNDVSSFAVRPDGLTFLGRVPSGGIRPTSLTVSGDLLYVLNAGGTGNITGFTGARHGELTPLAGSTRPLSGGTTNPAQVQFTPDGRVLLVTERATHSVSTYRVGADGRASGPTVYASAGRTPFGFAIDHRGRAFVSEAADSSLSSYDIGREGELTRLSSAVPNGQAAACWAVVTEDGHFAYTANAANGTISGYRVASDGTVRLLTSDGRTGVTGGNPTDMALSQSSRYLYVLTNAAQAIRAFRVAGDGRLIPATGASGLASGMVGLAAR